MVIYLNPCVCLKQLRENKGEERWLAEEYSVSLWLLAVNHCVPLVVWLYFWQAFRYSESPPACLHAVRNIVWSQAPQFPHSWKPLGHFSRNLRKCCRLPHLQAATPCPCGVAHSCICYVRGRPDDTVRISFWICRYFFNEIALNEALASSKSQIPTELSNITQLWKKSSVIPSLCLFAHFMSSVLISLGFPTPKYCLMRRFFHLAPVTRSSSCLVTTDIISLNGREQ